MPFLGYEQVTVSSSVLTVSALTIPDNTTHVEIQASAQDISYTMDDGTDPTATAGMFLLTTEPPKEFLIADIRRIRVIRVTGSDGELNLHYSGPL